MAPGNFAKAKAAEVPHEPTNIKEAVPVGDQAEFKKDMANFLGVNPCETKDVDLKTIALQSKERCIKTAAVGTRSERSQPSGKATSEIGS